MHFSSKGKTELQKLLLEIARCPYAQSILKKAERKEDCFCGCQEVVLSQRTLCKFDFDNWQVPEPWAGDLEKASILFIGSNPSFNPEEKFPSLNSSDEEIYDFFNNRFSKKYTCDLRPLLREGAGAGTGPVRYWSVLHNLAARLLNNDNLPYGEGYAFTEIVHCKSKGQRGVAAASEICVKQYLERVLQLSSAQIIIFVGTIARKYWKEMFGDENQQGTMVVNKMNSSSPSRSLIWLPHPSARILGGWRAETVLGEENLRKLQNMLKPTPSQENI